MCGIFGSINYRVEKDTNTIYQGLKHRGPDQQNYHQQDKVQLFHTRLAIQDLTESGRQPMTYGGLYISFNGEIYNHLELRKKYDLNHPSRSDTMTILMMYEKLGMKMLEDFDGMFAFCLYDTNRQQVFLVRDRAGKKPLYIWQQNSSYVFSSELNTLNHVLKPSVNEASINEFLYLGFCFRQHTAYNNIWELENGSFLQIDLAKNEQKIEQWFDIQSYYTKKVVLSEAETLAQLDAKLHKVIQNRIDSSDLDVGAFLSGGIDSGLITAIASKYKEQLKTFTIRLPGAYDESELAAMVAKRYNTHHTAIDISFDRLQQDFEKIVLNYGEPYRESSSIPSYYVSKAAKEHITVVLNGDGADELFGGYRRYVPFRYFDFFSKTGFANNTLGKLSSMMPIAHEKKSTYNYIYRLLKFAGYKDATKMYSGASTDLFVGYEHAFKKLPELKALRQMLDEISALPISGLKKILIADFNTILFSALLPKMDIATMAHSLEGRSPFLAKDILEFAPTVADKYKINGTTTKYLLRTLAKQYLPEPLINQPKRGFEIPLKKWMDNDLKPILDDYLSSSNLLYTNFIDKGFVNKLYNRQVAVSDEKRAKMLYAILCLEIWHKNMITKESPIMEEIMC